MHTSILLGVLTNILAVTSAHVLPRQAQGSISCNQGGANAILVSDIQNLTSNLNIGKIAGAGASFDLASTLTISQPSDQIVTQGSLKVHLNNFQPFVSTHVAFTTVA